MWTSRRKPRANTLRSAASAIAARVAVTQMPRPGSLRLTSGTVSPVGPTTKRTSSETGLTSRVSAQVRSVPAATFVTLSVVGSGVWLDQPYWNFRLYYALPLVLELGHRFIDQGRWRWLLLAGNLLAVQTIGNLPYFMPVVSLIVRMRLRLRSF